MTNDGPKEAKLDDIIYDFGGKEAICLSGLNTPLHVLCAYKELCDCVKITCYLIAKMI